VDWEGLDLRNENLRAFQEFHAVHPDVPLTHFLNAAYFTKSAEDKFINEWSPYEAFSPIDDYGLHVHGLKSLVDSSGVQYRSEPSWIETPEQVEMHANVRKEFRRTVENYAKVPKWLKSMGAFVAPKSAAEYEQRIKAAMNYLNQDVGYDVDISAYSTDELQNIISNSKTILERQGLPVGNSFRAGAWLAASNVLEAARREGFLVDSSAVGFDQMVGDKKMIGKTDLYRDKPFAGMLRVLWPGISNESQPFVLKTPAGPILEMPDTGGMADYVTVEEMVDHVDNAVQQLDSDDRYVHLGFHQETAARNAAKVIAVITQIQQKHGHRVVFETLQASAQHALSLEHLKNEAHVIRDS